MIDKFKKIFFSYWFLALVFSIPTFSTLIRSGYFPMHDDISAMRLLEMDKCVKDGQIPCRWVPDMGFGYGYPQFNFYAPAPYYLMEGFHLTGLGYLDSVKAGFIVSFILSTLGMYLLGKSLWGSLGGFVSAVFYSYLPYRAMDAFARGAVGELYALALIPFVFWACREALLGRKRAVLWLALSLSALLGSHNITGMIFLPFFVGWAIFLVFSQKLSLLPDFKKRIFELGSGIVWGLGISSFFILPAFVERNLVHIKTLTGGYFDFLAHFVSFSQLFFSSYFGYGTSEAGPWDETLFTVGIFHWAIPVLAIVVAYALKKRKEIPNLLFWVVAGLVAAFLAHGRSVFLWKTLPFTSFIQFPWRLLILSGFFFSVGAGAIALFFPKGGRKLLYALALCLIVILFYAGMFKPLKWLNITDAEKFSGEAWQRQQTVSIFDYLPITVKKGPTHEAPQMPRVVSGDAEVSNWQKGTDWQKGEIVVKQKATLEFPIYYFPNWEVIANGNKLNLDYQNDLGLISVSLEPGDYEITAGLRNTPVRTLGNIISLIGFILIPLYLRKK